MRKDLGAKAQSWVHPANEYLQYFSREDVRREKENLSRRRGGAEKCRSGKDTLKPFQEEFSRDLRNMAKAQIS